MLAVYAQTAGHGFVNYDDPSYVSANSQVARGLSLDGFAWAFSSGHMSSWSPLTWLSHMLDVQLFGLDPGAHHMVSVALHAATSVLLFLVLSRMTGDRWRSAFVAALFALHPLRVESVAWVSARKDVLSGLFFVLSLGAWTRWVERPRASAYLLALGLFALGLLAKPMLVTLPFVLLLLDVWPLRRGARGVRALVSEKLPFFVLAAASSLVTYAVQESGGAVRTFDAVPLGVRLANLPVSYATYLVKTIWPTELTVFHPLPPMQPAWRVAGSLLLLGAISVAALRDVRRRPALAVGWLWFIGMLVPVSGLVQVGGQAWAERYSYLPSIGLGVAAAWSVPSLAPRALWPVRALAVGALSVAALLSFRQVGVWRDSISLWTHALAVSPENYLAQSKLATLAIAAGRPDEAIARLELALHTNPAHAASHVTLAAALEQVGRADEARAHLERALELEPAFAIAHFNLANLLLDQARASDAEAHYRAALRGGLELGAVHQGLALALDAQGRTDEARRERELAGAPP